MVFIFEVGVAALILAAGFFVGRWIYLRRMDSAIRNLIAIRDNFKEDFECRQIAIDNELKSIGRAGDMVVKEKKYKVYGSLVLEQVEEKDGNS